MLDDESVLVENDKKNKFRHDLEALKYKKIQQQMMNEVNSKMINDKIKDKKKVAKKNPVQVDSDVALSLINNKLLLDQPEAPAGKVSFII